MRRKDMENITTNDDLNVYEDEIEEESNNSEQGGINMKIILNEKDLSFD